MRTPGRPALPGAVMAAVLAASGCSAGQVARAPLPPPPQIVNVTVTDHRFAYNPAIRAGRVVFSGHNLGRTDHTMRVFPMGDDWPPIDVQLHGPVRRRLVPFGGTRIKPGKTNSFAVDLVPGQRYAMLDLDQNSAHVPYALIGLDSEFRAK